MSVLRKIRYAVGVATAATILVLSACSIPLAQTKTLDKPLIYDDHIRIETVVRYVPPRGKHDDFKGGYYPVNRLEVDWFENPQADTLFEIEGEGEYAVFRRNIYKIILRHPSYDSPLYGEGGVNRGNIFTGISRDWDQEGFILKDGSLVSLGVALGFSGTPVGFLGGGGQPPRPALRIIRRAPYVRESTEDPEVLLELGKDLYENATKIGTR